MPSDAEQRFNKYLEQKNQKPEESNGYTRIATSLLTLVILGAYVYGSLWLLESRNLFYQTVGVLALIIALLILQTAVLTGVVNKNG